MTAVLDSWLAAAPRATGLGDLRRRAGERFAALGFPTGREEAWRFTDVTPLAETAFESPARASEAGLLAGAAGGPLKSNQIAFVDGFHEPRFTALESDKGVSVRPLSRVLAEEAASLEGRLGALERLEGSCFAALNTALASDGAVVDLARGAAPRRPLHLLFLNGAPPRPIAVHPRVHVRVGSGARVTLVESHVGPVGGTYLANAVVEVDVADGAVVDYVTVQRHSHQAFHVGSLHFRLGRAASLTYHSIALGARFARIDVSAELAGEGADVTLNGLYEVGSGQLVDHHTSIDHARPHGTSRELFKGILSGNARAVFDGRIVVRPGAAKTDAVQVNRNLLLSKQALVNTKPQLEIFADDVKCRHGATIGQLDESVLFYLRSRGIGLDDAKRLLVHAFASEIVDGVRVPEVRAQLGGCLRLLVPAVNA